MNWTIRICSVLLMLVVITGCAEPQAKLIPARGTIKINGKPAGNISIQFLPDVKEKEVGAFPSSLAISKDDGSFELATHDNQPGAVPGKHKVILNDIDEERPEQGKERTKPIRLDASYSVAGNLTATVEEGKSIELVIP
jgi:hypothetical protein